MRHGLSLLLVAAVAAVVVVLVLQRHDAPEGGSRDVSHEGDSKPQPGSPVLVGSPETRGLGADAGLGDEVVSGLVVDETGAPAADVSVIARPEARDPWREQDWTVAAYEAPPQPTKPIARATTEADGTFRVSGLPLAVGLWVEARPPAPRVGTRRWISFDSLGDTPVKLAVLAGGSLRGRLVEENGRGLQGWILAHTASDDPDRRLDVGAWAMPPHPTDAEGTFVLEAVPLGLLHLDAWVPGRGALGCVPARVPSEEVVLRLVEPGGCRVVGRVSSAGGDAVAGARVRVDVTRDDDGARALGLATTSDDGRYEIGSLPEGTVAFVEAAAEANRAVHQSMTPDRLRAGRDLTCDLVLDVRATVHGVLRDELGAPVGNVRVSAGRDHYCYDPPSARSDAEGRYRISGVPAGRVFLEVAGTFWSRKGATPLKASGLGERRGLLVHAEHDAQVLSVDLVLQRGARVAGRVVDGAGRSVVGATVRARSPHLEAPLRDGPWPRRTTDEDGQFEFESLRAGDDWRLDAAAGGARSTPLTPLHLEAGASVADLVLELRPVASLAGRVVDTAGAPLHAITVALDEEDLETTTDEAGAFAFRRLFPGSHTLCVRPANLGGFSMAVERRTLELAPGENRSDVIIELGASLPLAGVVVDDEARPLAGVVVILERVDASLAMPVLTYTDPRGRFRCRGVEPGIYRATVDGVPMALEIRAGDEDVRLVMSRKNTWTLRGTVLGPADRPVPQARVTTRPYPSSPGLAMRHDEVRNGAFEVLVPSTWPAVTVEVDKAVAADGTPLAVLPWTRESVTSEDGPLTVQLQEAQSLTGRVVDVEGRPIPGVRIYGCARAGRTLATLLATTDEDGRFQAGQLPPAPQHLHLLPPDGWGRPNPVVASPGQPALEIVLPKSTVFAGRVVDDQGQGIAGALVVFTDGESTGGASTEYEFRYRHLPWVLTDHEGRFRAAILPEGTFDITVGAPPDRHGEPWPYLPRVVANVRTPKVPLRVQLVKGVFLEAEVYDTEGAPAPDCRVFAVPASGGFADRVDLKPVELGSHRHRSEALAPGDYVLRARCHARDQESEEVRVTAPATGVRLQLKGTLEIRGRIDGARYESFKLVFRATDGSGIRADGRSQRDGTFVIGVDANAVGVLYARLDGDDRYALLEGVTATGGPYTLALRTGLSIRGRVAGGTGDGYVYVSGPHGLSWSHRFGDDGAFEVRGLPPGSYDLRARRLGGDSYRRNDVAAGSRDVVLER